MDNLDCSLGESLQKNFKHESRRSFLSKMTRALFGLCGVSVAATIPPLLARTAPKGAAAAPAGWEECGLHGALCAGPCTPSLRGPGEESNEGLNQYTHPPNINALFGAWKLCCDAGDTYPAWRCCKYNDYCGRQSVFYPEHPDLECGGKTLAGNQWCGGSIYSPPGEEEFQDYICTQIVCETTEHATWSDCAAVCTEVPDTINCTLDPDD